MSDPHSMTEAVTPAMIEGVVESAVLLRQREEDGTDYTRGFNNGVSAALVVAKQAIIKAAMQAARPIDQQERDDCELCFGQNGGVPGNENIVGGLTVCDYCHALLIAMRAARPIDQQEAWKPIETAQKDYKDGQPPLLTWSAVAGYGLTYGPTINGGYGHQTHWQHLPAAPEPSPIAPVQDDE